jgi:hypothetical protein
VLRILGAAQAVAEEAVARIRVEVVAAAAAAEAEAEAEAVEMECGALGMGDQVGSGAPGDDLVHLDGPDRDVSPETLDNPLHRIARGVTDPALFEWTPMIGFRAKTRSVRWRGRSAGISRMSSSARLLSERRRVGYR